MNWTREQLMVALGFYIRTPFGKLDARNPDIVSLAETIGRSANAFAMKCCNFASLDPFQKARGISGLKGASNLDKKIWAEFDGRWEVLGVRSEEILRTFDSELQKKELEEINHEFPKGIDTKRIIKQRIGQSFFRKTVIGDYDQKCAITGIGISQLLIASHIIPWSKNQAERTNPHNGICLNALHDKAFDRGLITITPEFKIKLSQTLLKNEEIIMQDYFAKWQDKQIHLPERFLPDPSFLEWHNTNVFQE